jgi:peptide/nickel transport system ATP-binding protein
MYLGRIVERGGADEVLGAPRHPYTQALISAIPRVDVPRADTVLAAPRRLSGELPSPANPPQGCPFHPRCPHAMEVCVQTAPPFRAISATHFVACFSEA